MIVISDTTPLISLMKIGHLDLIHQLFGEIQVPEAVFKELTSNNRFQNESKQIEECPYINKVKVVDIKSVELLRKASGLDLGESEAIILSDYVNASYLLMDEAKGRKVAQKMGIQIMGTIGMLMIAYKEKLLSKEEIISCIHILKNSGRHISEKLYEQLMNKFDKENDEI
jgi:predicted nucleic acid-binding protein